MYADNGLFLQYRHTRRVTKGNQQLFGQAGAHSERKEDVSLRNFLFFLLKGTFRIVPTKLPNDALIT
jgi:hypothetical protein